MAAAICLILGAGFLAPPPGGAAYGVNPDALATAGAVWALRGQARVTLTADAPYRDALAALAVRANPAARDLTQPACPEDTTHRALADTAPRDGAVWLPPDQIDSGGGPALDYARTIRDLAGLADPRPMAPWRVPLPLWRLDPSPGPDALLAHLFQSPDASWVTLGGAVLLSTPAQPPAPPPTRADALGVHPTGHLFLTDRLVIADTPPDGATPWHQARFTQR